MASVPRWRVRPAGPDDAAALALIGAATFLETFAGVLAGPAIIAHCRRAHAQSAYAGLLANGAQAWLAEVEPDGAPVGFALLAEPDLPGTAAGDIELKRIYVLSRFHGTGIGAALLVAALDAAAGRQRVLLGVYAGNERAISFYRKQNFTALTTRKFDVGGTLYDDFVLARPLA